jgi:glycosyltransferase involved in cell wall biosynthesis/GT2 family glycosyltransferase
MQVGIVPLLDFAGGGVHQYSLAVLRALDKWALEDGRDHFTAFVEDANHPAVANLSASRWKVRTLEPTGDAGPSDYGVTGLQAAFLQSLASISPSASDPRVRFRPANSRWFCHSTVELMLYPVPNALAFETGIPYVMAIHDLQHRLQPEFPEVSAGGQWEAREYLHRNGCRYASLLIADSEVGKQDILEAYSSEGVTPDRIRIVPFAPFSYFAARPSGQDAQRVRAAYHLPKRYLFYPAQFWPHKNHVRIVEALARLHEERKLKIPIIFCGSYADAICQQTFDDVMSLAARAGLKSHVRYLGYVSDEDIAGLYTGATGLIMPTFFGPTNIPVVEAWAFGCPVLTSDIRGVRDQAGDAALLVDPHSVESIAKGILRIWSDDGLRRTLAERGRKRAAAHTIEGFQKGWREVLREAKWRVRAERAGRITRAAQALAEAGTLRAIIEEKEAAIQEQHAARVELVGRLEESHAAIHALEEAAASARELKARLTRELEAKEAVIREQDRALRAYRAAFVFLHPLVRALSRLRSLVRPLSRLRSLVRPLSRLRRAGVRAKAILRPRLGVLKQHAPRSLTAPPRQMPRANPAPRISLVTPSYRQAEFIERTLRSVLDQTYPALEYFVQDGASDDGTVAILERYADRLAGWESRRDAGQSEALNRGFARTTGDIMGWLNSDDLLLPGALARVADHFHDHPEVDVVYGHRIVIDEDDAEIGRWILPPHDNAVLSWADYLPQETLFWRRRLWDRTGARIDESFRFAMDWDLVVRFREAGARFARVPQFLGAFRVHRHQKTSAVLLENGFREMDRIRERALGRVPSGIEVRKAIAPYLRRHVAADVAWRVARRIGAVTSRTARSAWQRLPTVLLCALVRYQ